MKKINLIIALLITCAFVCSQTTITGTFSKLANQQIKLVGFSGFDKYTIDSVKANEKGVFFLNYGNKDFGMGYLAANNDQPFLVVLSGETIMLKGADFALPETIEILEGTENHFFEQYTSEHQSRELALSAWDYLEKIYKRDAIFSVQQIPKQAISNEKQRIKAEDSLFLNGLGTKSYVSWYLKVRNLVSSVSTIAQYRTEEIPAAIAAFRNMDYTDSKLFKSGLLGSVVESHFWLIENSGHSLDSVYIEMNISIDNMVNNLLQDEQKLNEITEYLFKFLEKRSLFSASEYLALKLLNERGCTIERDFAAQLENYRTMKKGNTAPDFDFNKDFVAPGYAAAEIPRKLSELHSKYMVVIFGASWCPLCPKELSQTADLYSKWKEQGVEVVFVSLDDDKVKFKSFTSIFPFISICDYEKWESPIIKSYHVFATPTIYLLNKKREILLRPNNVSHLDSWIDWYLVQGNKL